MGKNTGAAAHRRLNVTPIKHGGNKIKRHVYSGVLRVRHGPRKKLGGGDGEFGGRRRGGTLDVVTTKPSQELLSFMGDIEVFILSY